MEDLRAFLGARLDEDEAAAKEAAGDTGPEWNCFPEGLHGGIVVADGGIVVYDEGRPAEAEAEHIARHDPARVLREVAAKRAILAEHEPEPWGKPHPELLRCTQGHGDDGYWTIWPCDEVRIIVAVYSDHPDYRPAWKL